MAENRGTIEVSRDRWRLFCERLTELDRGGMVRIEVEEAEGQKRTIVENETLQRVMFDDESDPCNDLIIIETGEAGEKARRHRIIEPVYIRLKNGENERYNHVHILAESGTTIITLKPGLNPALAREFAYTRLAGRR